jgi:UDP:flavonoid glycosyltransferase YjiC (YdhE family)
MLNDYKSKISIIQQKAEETRAKAETARVNHEKKVANLENQISILKTRLEQEIEKAKQAALSRGSSKRNPFASGGTSEAVAPEKVRLSREYAIMEITGRDDDLVAKLINEDGDVFMAKVGTTLRNGYTIDEITQTFLSAVKDSDKDYLYFSAGGILDREPTKPEVNIKRSESSAAEESSSGNFRARSGRLMSTQGIPSLSRGMVVK